MVWIWTSTRSKRLLGLAATALVALMAPSCDRADYTRSEMNPRKVAIYSYASSLCEIDEHASVMSLGPMGPPTNHPARLKAPYPVRAEMEAAIGKADSEETERVTYTVIGGMGKEEEEEDQVLTWWERDSTWEVYQDHRMVKPGHREIIKAWIDPEGRLKKLFILHPYGSEFIGRHSGFWQWFG